MHALALLSLLTATVLALPRPQCLYCGIPSAYSPLHWWNTPEWLLLKNPKNLWAATETLDSEVAPKEEPAYAASIAPRYAAAANEDMAGVYYCEHVGWGGACNHLTTPLGSDPTHCTALDERTSSVRPDEGFYCIFYTNAFCAPIASDGSDALGLTFPGSDNLLVTEKGDFNDRLRSYHCFREEEAGEPEMGTPPNSQPQ